MVYNWRNETDEKVLKDEIHRKLQVRTWGHETIMGYYLKISETVISKSSKMEGITRIVTNTLVIPTTGNAISGYIVQAIRKQYGCRHLVHDCMSKLCIDILVLWLKGGGKSKRYEKTCKSDTRCGETRRNDRKQLVLEYLLNCDMSWPINKY